MPDPRRNLFDGVTDYFSEIARMRTLGTHGALHAADPGGELAERTHASAWVPATDIFAIGDDLVIQVEVPGVAAADIDLRFHHGVLTVSGARVPSASRAERSEYYLRERYRGEFRRSITLPEGTDPANLAAQIGDGLVEVTVRDAAHGTASTRIELADRTPAPTSRPVRTSGAADGTG